MAKMTKPNIRTTTHKIADAHIVFLHEDFDQKMFKDSLKALIDLESECTIEVNCKICGEMTQTVVRQNKIVHRTIHIKDAIPCDQCIEEMKHSVSILVVRDLKKITTTHTGYGMKIPHAAYEKVFGVRPDFPIGYCDVNAQRVLMGVFKIPRRVKNKKQCCEEKI